MESKTPTIAQPATIGRRTGVANILGVNFSGFIAGWLRRTIYPFKLPIRKETRLALDWTFDLIFSNNLVQFLDLRAAMISRPKTQTRRPNPRPCSPNCLSRFPKVGTLTWA